MASSGSHNPLKDPQYLRTLTPRQDYLPPEPVIAKVDEPIEMDPPGAGIPEPTPQPPAVIVYIPYPVEVLVPYPVEKTTNVCPVEERKQPAKPIAKRPAKVCR